MSSKATIISISTANDQDWDCTLHEHRKRLCRYPQKETALDMGRAIAMKRSPSLLKVFRSDGSLETEEAFE